MLPELENQKDEHVQGMVGKVMSLKGFGRPNWGFIGVGGEERGLKCIEETRFGQ